MVRNRHPAHGTPWLYRCPQGHASVELYATSFRCIGCRESYPKAELVHVLDDRARDSRDAAPASEALGVRVDGGDHRESHIEGPFPEVDKYGRLTGRYYRCAGCGVEAMTREVVRECCECECDPIES